MSIRKLLYEYPSYVQAIQNYRQQILVTTGERTYPNMIGNYELETPPNHTNELNSTTENHAIRNIINQAKEIEKIQKDLREYERVVRAISIALNKLKETDRQIIELRYFKKPKTPWLEIENKLYISERHARRLEHRALKDLEIELRHIRVIKSRG